jgi:hypothetical protein
MATVETPVKPKFKRGKDEISETPIGVAPETGVKEPRPKREVKLIPSGLAVNLFDVSTISFMGYSNVTPNLQITNNSSMVELSTIKSNFLELSKKLEPKVIEERPIPTVTKKSIESKISDITRQPIGMKISSVLVQIERFPEMEENIAYEQLDTMKKEILVAISLLYGVGHDMKTLDQTIAKRIINNDIISILDRLITDMSITKNTKYVLVDFIFEVMQSTYLYGKNIGSTKKGDYYLKKPDISRDTIREYNIGDNIFSSEDFIQQYTKNFFTIFGLNDVSSKALSKTRGLVYHFVKLCHLFNRGITENDQNIVISNILHTLNIILCSITNTIVTEISLNNLLLYFANAYKINPDHIMFLSYLAFQSDYVNIPIQFGTMDMMDSIDPGGIGSKLVVVPFLEKESFTNRFKELNPSVKSVDDFLKCHVHLFVENSNIKFNNNLLGITCNGIAGSRLLITVDRNGISIMINLKRKKNSISNIVSLINTINTIRIDTSKLTIKDFLIIINEKYESTYNKADAEEKVEIDEEDKTTKKINLGPGDFVFDSKNDGPITPELVTIIFDNIFAGLVYAKAIGDRQYNVTNSSVNLTLDILTSVSIHNATTLIPSSISHRNGVISLSNLITDPGLRNVARNISIDTSYDYYHKMLYIYILKTDPIYNLDYTQFKASITLPSIVKLTINNKADIKSQLIPLMKEQLTRLGISNIGMEEFVFNDLYVWGHNDENILDGLIGRLSENDINRFNKYILYGRRNSSHLKKYFSYDESLEQVFYKKYLLYKKKYLELKQNNSNGFVQMINSLLSIFKFN